MKKGIALKAALLVLALLVIVAVTFWLSNSARVAEFVSVLLFVLVSIALAIWMPVHKYMKEKESDAVKTHEL